MGGQTMVALESDTYVHTLSTAPLISDTADIAVVIPAFNEELVIGTVVLRSKMYVDSVIVVDDGSTDRTSKVAAMAGAKIVRLDENHGKAFALLQGIQKAKEFGFSTVIALDGDGQHNPEDIEAIAQPILNDEADLVIGSRFLNVSSHIPFYRLFGQITLNFFTNVGSKAKTTDSQSGFRALGKSALENMDFISDGYNIESDMIQHFSSRNLRIKEVPIEINYDVPHQHKRHPIPHGVDILVNLVGFIGYKRPLLFFGIPGAFLSFIGVIIATLAVSQFYSSHIFPFPLTVVAVFAVILGLLLFASGIILNSIVAIMKSVRN
ncbi:MAG: glycosyltransferase family 2 protein [Methanomicrobiaceae archaeon]|nr:glycosyltransferase family 2 protein [Methanomicrobiaceae archaeon]